MCCSFAHKQSFRPARKMVNHLLIESLLARGYEAGDVATTLANFVANLPARGTHTCLAEVCRNLSAVVEWMMRTQPIDQVPSFYEKIFMRKKSFGILGLCWGLRDFKFAWGYRVPCFFGPRLLPDAANSLVQNQGGQKIYWEWCLYAPIFIFKICSSFEPFEVDLSGLTNLFLPSGWTSTMLC